MSVDYKSTVFLPRADNFPMRARLPQREPETLKAWDEMDLFGRLREQSKGREKFVLHDGPPYANGHLHMGHALNKILKDAINRSMQMLGYDAHYVPGWDCHGLPIEWKVEEGYREQGKDKDSVDPVEFRRECREFADYWISQQIEEFKRFGVVGNWSDPYLTMSYPAEAQIVREIGKFLLNGGMYKGDRPVLWSVAEKTALADAEVEYHEHTSRTIWVRFPVVTASQQALDGASVMIWTTTPWTIPGNRAIAYDAEESYAVVEVTEPGEGSLTEAGEKLVVGKALLEQVASDCALDGYKVVAELKGAELDGTVTAHPFRGQGYEFDVPLLAGDFVTMDQGTGFVHIAPGHGTDDWLLGRRHNLAMPHNVDADGYFVESVPLFAGARVYTPEGKHGDANGRVIDALKDAGKLVTQGKLRHSYPHSWRSKVPLIFRNTPQWFISMETNDLRKKALSAIEETDFYLCGVPEMVVQTTEHLEDRGVPPDRVFTEGWEGDEVDEGEFIADGAATDPLAPNEIIVRIDVKPDAGGENEKSPINLKSKGRVPVAIFGDAEFDTATLRDYRRFVDGKPRYDGASSFLEARGIDLGEQALRLRRTDHPAAGDSPGRVDAAVSRCAQEVVDQQSAPEHRGALEPVAIKRHEAGQRRHQVRKPAHEPPALGHRLPEARQIQALQIAQAAMNDAQALPTGGAPEITALQQQRAQAGKHGLQRQRDPSARQPAGERVVADRVADLGRQHPAVALGGDQQPAVVDAHVDALAVLFDPSRLASTIGGGILQSVGDLFLTSGWLVLLAAAAILFVVGVFAGIDRFTVVTFKT